MVTSRDHGPNVGKDAACLEGPDDATRTICTEAMIVARRLEGAPLREPPRKFLPEPLRTFVGKLSAGRPPGWREASGVCLDLSIPELAFVATKMGGVAAASIIGSAALVAGRVLLLGLESGANTSSSLTMFDSGGDDVTLAVACRLGAAGAPEIAWAQYRKPVTFELSEYEAQALEMVFERH